MIAARLSVFFVLCAFVSGAYVRKRWCYSKEVPYEYCYGDHGYISTYTSLSNPAQHGGRCRDVENNEYDKHEYCPKHLYRWDGTLTYGDYKHNMCDEKPCYTAIEYGMNKCHGRVKLTKPKKYYVNECRYYGCPCKSNLQLGYQRVWESQCACFTRTCDKSFRTCYHHAGSYYEGYVAVKVPCGCECFKKKYEPTPPYCDYYQYYGIYDHHKRGY